MRRRSIIFCIALAMILTLLYPSAAVRAEENRKLDVVLVLDQSGSMSDNDPNGMMRTAANMLITMMPANTGRVGVISFNREQTTVSELCELSDADTVEEITAKVQSIPYDGGTDIGNAVADAVEMFDAGDGRVHAILVLSDGRNDFGVDKNSEQQSDERLNDALVSAQNQGCRIYCLGFGEEMADVNDVPYQKLAGIASDPGTISTETDASNIHTFFVNMLADLIGSKIQSVTSGEIEIEPNVKEANIYLSSPSDLTSVAIEMTAPDGSQVALENSDRIRFYKDSYSAVIKMFSPEPGTYKLDVSAEDVEISVGYVAAYEYVLSSSVTDENGSPVTQVENKTTAYLESVISQDDNEIHDEQVYDSVTAKAVVTAKDTGEQSETDLAFRDGVLSGEVTFDHVAVYSIDVTVESDSFKLTDRIDIQANRRGISFEDGASAGTIEKKVLNKTFKRSAQLLVPEEELMAAVSDPDQVGVELAEVRSGDEEIVTAEITDDGILLTGTKWGTSKIDVTYRDGLGNTLSTSFTAKVADNLLVFFFAALPVLLVLVILVVIYLIMRKSRMIKGDFDISRVMISRGENDIAMINVPKTYRAKTFTGRKKTLGNGVARYAQEVYSADASLPQHQALYQMFANNQAEMKRNLNEVRFVGTYLGRRGCSIRIKKGAPVSMSNNRSYGKPVKIAWTVKSSFKIFTKDAEGTEICIEGVYRNAVRNTGASGQRKHKKGRGNAGPVQGPAQQQTGPDFEDDFFL